MIMFDSPFMMLPGITPQEYSYLQSATTGFTELQLKRFLMIYSSKRRNPDDMVLYCILGFFVPGLPRFLLNQIGMGILYFFTYGLCGIGTIIDLVNHKNLAFEYNQRMVFESLQMIKMGTIL
ncbi:TM2 domain-containing protein [Pedobacter nutrimenti]|jgi:TM2 domain-containing membrane protein YozV|uniref:TM2 domain-containing protein n=1 Tax=Pedobacter nutrimenti TaxID=1241337 RepID=A0A318UL21_9SPHI|nr:TM2 domain-containing protein [Pedobacter nutrimenti]PYF75808.1 TM2 domain-containing protein [Pedobacter nutrimenti]